VNGADLEAVRAAHPDWQIWESRGGRNGNDPSGNFYATPAWRSAHWGGVTLSAADPGELGEMIVRQEDSWAALLAPPAGRLSGLSAF
jgi:hypothetical protein